MTALVNLTVMFWRPLYFLFELLIYECCRNKRSIPIKTHLALNLWLNRFWSQNIVPRSIMFANERKLWRKPQIHEERITVVENKKSFFWYFTSPSTTNTKWKLPIDLFHWLRINTRISNYLKEGPTKQLSEAHGHQHDLL